MEKSPYIIALNHITFNGLDFDITVAEFQKHVPFEVKRVYWLKSQGMSVTRGNHAHLNSSQVIVVLQGSVQICITDQLGAEFKEELDSDRIGIYIPTKHWLKIDMSSNAFILCLSSHKFEDQETTYDFNEFISSK